MGFAKHHSIIYVLHCRRLSADLVAYLPLAVLVAHTSKVVIQLTSPAARHDFHLHGPVARLLDFLLLGVATPAKEQASDWSGKKFHHLGFAFFAVVNFHGVNWLSFPAAQLATKVPPPSCEVQPEQQEQWL